MGERSLVVLGRGAAVASNGRNGIAKAELGEGGWAGLGRCFRLL